MTYDEAVNDLVRRYCNDEFKGWVLTDDYNAQMRRILPDGRFEFIAFENLAIFHNIIDLEDYSDGELWFFGSMYYDTMEEFEAQGAEVMAECVFEQTPSTVLNIAEGDVEALYAEYVAFVKGE